MILSEPVAVVMPDHNIPGQNGSFQVDLPTMDEFDEAYGESFEDALNLDTWRTELGLIENLARIEAEIAGAVAIADEYRTLTRSVFFPLLRTWRDVCKDAGVYSATQADLDRVHRGILFNGGIEACSGMSVVHTTLPLTITQIGICLASYDGAHGTWAHRTYHRELHQRAGDPIDDLFELFENSQHHPGSGNGGRSSGQQLNELARRGMTAYAERAVLRDRATASWRMAHGSPIPWELISGLWVSTHKSLRVALSLIESIVAHKRFLFIPAGTQRRDLLMIGNALGTREYAIVDTLEGWLNSLIDRSHYREENGVLPEMRRFARDIAPQIALGIYRVHESAPPYLFYAHVDHVHTAAHIALADAQLQELRGFPMLLDLASTVSHATFGVDSLIPMVQTAYAASDQPLRYLNANDLRS